jgi:spore germination protein YaaH
MDIPHIDEDVDVEEEVVVVELKPELNVDTINGSYTLSLEEYEADLYKEERLLAMDHFKSVYRLMFDMDYDSNLGVLVYEDQTVLLDFNSLTQTINGQSQILNLMTIKTGVVYVNIENLSDLFMVSYEHIEEPFLGIKVDFNSQGETTFIEDTMTLIKEALPEKINMTWEAVYSGGTDVSKLYEMPGLDIISPVWYDLDDASGAVKSRKQDDYIEWANAMGYDLWPAITNSFDPEMTSALLHSIPNRTAFIDKMVTLYANNQFEGINIDFENIYKEDKDALSQFIAELTAAFHRKNMIVSMDVTFAGGSDTWSKCYDRYKLGQWVDYIVVMSYDQHWGSSPVSGTVAGLTWVDQNLELLTKEVDSDKIIMGIPFYMRVWFERPSKEFVNHMKVTSDAITMHRMEIILETEDYTMLWDEVNGQNYISYIDPEDNAVKKIWIEDVESLKLKVELVHKYNLKGIASWRRGYELESVWPALEDVLEK